MRFFLQSYRTSQMSKFTPKSILILLIVLPTINILNAKSDYPNWHDTSTFQTGLRSAALISNLPNAGGEDHYLGLSTSINLIPNGSDGAYYTPAARFSIYPNPGYNLWAQFAHWPADNPSFSVGTGIQVEFPGENQETMQGIGISWNTIYGDAYNQRDISVHALYGFSRGSLDFGLIAMLDMHHILIENSRGIPDYDETLLQAVPYISWMLLDQAKLSFSLPLDVEGPALSIAYEYLIDRRK